MSGDSKYDTTTEQTSQALDPALELGLVAVTAGMSVAFTPSDEFTTIIREDGNEVARGTGATADESQDNAMDNLRGK